MADGGREVCLSFASIAHRPRYAIWAIKNFAHFGEGLNCCRWESYRGRRRQRSNRYTRRYPDRNRQGSGEQYQPIQRAASDVPCVGQSGHGQERARGLCQGGSTPECQALPQPLKSKQSRAWDSSLSDRWPDRISGTYAQVSHEKDGRTVGSDTSCLDTPDYRTYAPPARWIGFVRHLPDRATIADPARARNQPAPTSSSAESRSTSPSAQSRWSASA